MLMNGSRKQHREGEGKSGEWGQVGGCLVSPFYLFFRLPVAAAAAASAAFFALLPFCGLTQQLKVCNTFFSLFFRMLLFAYLMAGRQTKWRRLFFRESPSLPLTPLSSLALWLGVDLWARCCCCCCRISCLFAVGMWAEDICIFVDFVFWFGVADVTLMNLGHVENQYGLVL